MSTYLVKHEAWHVGNSSGTSEATEQMGCMDHFPQGFSKAILLGMSCGIAKPPCPPEAMQQPGRALSPPH